MGRFFFFVQYIYGTKDKGFVFRVVHKTLFYFSYLLVSDI